MAGTRRPLRIAALAHDICRGQPAACLGTRCSGPKVASAQPRQPSATASGMCSRGLMGSAEGTGTSCSEAA
jgi:hypothetical protein